MYGTHQMSGTAENCTLTICLILTTILRLILLPSNLEMRKQGHREVQ